MGNATAVMVHGEIATVAYLPTEATVEEASKVTNYGHLLQNDFSPFPGLVW